MKITRKLIREMIDEELSVLTETSNDNLYMDLANVLRNAKDIGVSLDGTVHAIGEVLTDQMRVGYSTESVLQAFGKWIKRKESEQLKPYRRPDRGERHMSVL